MKYSLSFFILFLLALTAGNCLYVTSAQHFSFFSQILTFGLLLYLPGFLTLLSLKQTFKNTWLFILHSLGLSIGWLYILGLFGSYLFPLLGVLRPLDIQSYSLLHFGLILILSLVAFIRHIDTELDTDQVLQQLKESGGYVLVVLFSLVSVVGAFTLNQGGSNLLSFGWIFFLVTIFSGVAFFQKKKDDLLNPYILFGLSLSILWALSARSWHLLGWDIVQEYMIASLTVAAGKWSVDTIRDAYNACLSITILPAVLSTQTQLSLDAILKFVHPFLFAHFPVVVYFLGKKIANKNTAIFASVYLISQPFFIQPMIALARQETAFLFFGLLLLSIYTDSFKGKTKIGIVLFYIFALVTSHYSTTYVAIVLFTLVFSAILALQVGKRLPFRKKVISSIGYTNWLVDFSSSFKWWMFFGLLGFSYVWYFLITQSAGNVSATVRETFMNMTRIFSNEQQSQEVQKSLPGVSNQSETLQSDVDLFVKTYTGRGLQNNLIPDQVTEISKNYPLKPLKEVVIKPTLPAPLAAVINIGLSLYKDLLKYLLILGAAGLFIKTFFSREQKNLDFILLSTASAGFLLLMIFHPTLGVSYNVSRIYLQLLVFLGVTLVMSIEQMMWLLKERIRLIILTTAFVLGFLYLQGLLVPMIGGIPAVQYYNVGTDYEKFYVMEGELSAGTWLQKNRDSKRTVYADQLTGLRLRRSASFFPNTTILPLVIANNGASYVYLSATNTSLNKAQVNFNNKFLTYTYPEKMLQDRKNLIYSNSKSRIYK